MIQRWRFGEPLAPLVRLLAAGGVLAIPTESSYGLAVDPASAAGVETIYRLKGRERGKPLPVVAADRAQLAALGVPAAAPGLDRVAALWPAPLALLVPVARPLPAAAGSGRLAVRVPDHAGLRRLLAALGTALTATSANRSGEPPALAPEEAAALLVGVEALVVDGGRLPGGLPSTLIEPAPGGFRVLRPGRFDPARLGPPDGGTAAA